MSRTIYQFKIDSIIDHTPSVRELNVSILDSNEFKFRSGQFVMLHVPQKDAKPALRAYSIASSDENTRGFKLLFKFVESGVASNFVWQLNGQETLQFTGPFGRVFFAEPPTRQVIFVSTGTGLSQHLCYLLSNYKKHPQIKWKMLFGVRNESEIYYQKELDDLKKLCDFEYHIVLSRPSESWQGKKGYVQHHLSDFDFKNIDSTFYLCGNGGMIKEAKAILEEAQFDKAKVHSEAFD